MEKTTGGPRSSQSSAPPWRKKTPTIITQNAFTPLAIASQKEEQRLGIIVLDRVEAIDEEKLTHPSIRVKGVLAGKTCVFLIDSGATGDFVSSEFLHRHDLLGRCTSVKKKLVVKLADGKTYTTDKIVRKIDLDISELNAPERRDVVVLPLDGYDAILGMPWLKEVNPDINWKDGSISLRSTCMAVSSDTSMVPLSESDQVKLDKSLEGVEPKLASLVRKYEDVFREELPKGLPMKRPIEHKIDLKPGSEPVHIKQWRQSPKDRGEIEKQCRESQSAGWVTPSVSPYNAPNLLVHKPDDTERWCNDYRGVNEKTIKNKASMPNIQDLFDQLKDSTIFSRLDLKTGFHQIRIATDDTHKTAFSTDSGHYEWQVMPFGLCNAPATFQALMQYVLKDQLYKSVVVFIDDILIYSKNKEEHYLHVEWVIKKLREWKLYAASKKCEWGKSEIKFLGHIVSAAGVSVMREGEGYCRMA